MEKNYDFLMENVGIVANIFFIHILACFISQMFLKLIFLVNPCIPLLELHIFLFQETGEVHRNLYIAFLSPFLGLRFSNVIAVTALSTLKLQSTDIFL